MDTFTTILIIYLILEFIWDRRRAGEMQELRGKVAKIHKLEEEIFDKLTGIERMLPKPIKPDYGLGPID